MSEETRKQILISHIYGYGKAEIAKRMDVSETDVEAACSDFEAVDELRLYLREMGADV